MFATWELSLMIRRDFREKGNNLLPLMSMINKCSCLVVILLQIPLVHPTPESTNGLDEGKYMWCDNKPLWCCWVHHKRERICDSPTRICKCAAGWRCAWWWTPSGRWIAFPDVSSGRPTRLATCPALLVCLSPIRIPSLYSPIVFEDNAHAF